MVELATEATVIGFCDLGVVELSMYAFGEIIADTAESLGLTLVIGVEEMVDPTELPPTPTPMLLNEKPAHVEMIGLVLNMGVEEVLKFLEVLLAVTAILLRVETADTEELMELTPDIGVEDGIELAEMLLTPVSVLLTKELNTC